jgi:hypothetical protein
MSNGRELMLLQVASMRETLASWLMSGGMIVSSSRPSHSWLLVSASMNNCRKARIADVPLEATLGGGDFKRGLSATQISCNA